MQALVPRSLHRRGMHNSVSQQAGPGAVTWRGGQIQRGSVILNGSMPQLHLRCWFNHNQLQRRRLHLDSFLRSVLHSASRELAQKSWQIQAGHVSDDVQVGLLHFTWWALRHIRKDRESHPHRLDLCCNCAFDNFECPLNYLSTRNQKQPSTIAQNVLMAV